MSKVRTALNQASQLNNLNQRDQWVNRFHPLVKLSLTILFIVLVVSCDKYMASRLLAFLIYPVFVFIMGDLSVKNCLYRLRIILPVVCIMGIFNPIFDREIVMSICGVGISSGWLSMLTLMEKGVLTVLAAYLLVATTSVEGICTGLRMIHVPKVIVTVTMLIYRYLFVLFAEADRITTAYHLRAPGQKGIHYKAWGSLAGQLLIRSMDRAEYIYESMLLRGFNGDFPYSDRYRLRWQDGVYFVVWAFLLLVLRYTDILNIIGGLFV